MESEAGLRGSVTRHAWTICTFAVVWLGWFQIPVSDPITNAERIENHVAVLLMEKKRSLDEVERVMCGQLRQNIRLAVRRMREQGRIKAVGKDMVLVEGQA